MNEVLELRAVTVGYGGAPINHEVSLVGRPGAVTALIGPNGAGKSTLLKAVAGLLKPLSGRIVLSGQDVTGLAPHRIVRAGLGYVPQVSNVFPSLTVVENLEMGAYARPAGAHDRIEGLFDMFPDLRAAARRRARELSGGQRNMLAMARALMLDPAVLLLDEPTGGLAPAYVERVWERVTAIATAGTSVLVVEQNVDLALAHADWVYILIAGRNHRDGPAAEISALDLGAIFLGKAVAETASPAAVEAGPSRLVG